MPSIPRFLLALRYSIAGRLINQWVKALAPWAWRYLRDEALTGYTFAQPFMRGDDEKPEDYPCQRDEWLRKFRRALK